MGILKFFFKIGVLFFLILLLVFIVFRIRYSRSDTQFFLLNHLSNSISYNCNVQNLIEKGGLDQVGSLIIGSSMSLNNISGRMIQDSLKSRTYNISSWGFKSDQLVEFFREVHTPDLKRVLIAFNNLDLGPTTETKYNFSSTNLYIHGNTFIRACIFLKGFNYAEFNKNWYQRKNSQSLVFDDNGSVLLDSTTSKINEKNYHVYSDTSGFDFFLNEVLLLKKSLDKRNIRLTLVYLPYRHDLLTDKRSGQNDLVAAELKQQLGRDFIDLHRLPIEKGLYLDGSHMYKPAAEIITENILDSLKRNQNK